MAKIVELQRKYFPNTKPLPGVVDLLKTLSDIVKPPQNLALATSSHKGNFLIKTNHLQDVFSVFTEERRVLGDDPRIPSGRGKPAPDIYLLALKTINDGLRNKDNFEEIRPDECLVFEDSVPGVESGRRAGMQVVWCPHSGLLQEYQGKEEEVLAGLTGQHEEEIPPKVETAGQMVPGAPGELRDGWAILLRSLEDFPYSRFGMDV